MARDSKHSRHTLLVFPDGDSAERATRVLVAYGIDRRGVNLFVQAIEGRRSFQHRLDRAADAGGAAGAGLGALAGAVLFAMPGIGPVLSVGPLAAAITGALAGGAVGGLSGSLVGTGVSGAAAVLAEHHVGRGNAILLVESDGDGALISRIAHKAGAIDVVTF